MFCYRDRTFCKEETCKHFGPCHRSLTEQVEKAAEEAGLPISQFMNTPECFEARAKE